MDAIHLTEAEAQILCRARGLLVELQERFAAARHEGDAYNLGRMEHSADVADDAIFDVLNSLQAYTDDPVAKAYVQRRIHTAEVDTSEPTPLAIGNSANSVT